MWVLILILPFFGGKVMTSAEFESQRSCQNAAKVIITGYRYKPDIAYSFCVKK